MATKKNFTVKEYNGADYDTLYPETNSGQVLLDNTAKAELGLAGGGQTPPTLDDALSKLNKFDNRYEIGDVLTTSRTNLSDKWLLCNGATLDNGEYPELGAQFSGVEMHFDKVSKQSFTMSANIKPFDYSVASRKLDNGSEELLMSIKYKYDYVSSLYYKNLSVSGDWVLLGDADTVYYAYSMNNNFVIIPISNADLSSYKAKYCIGSPTSFSSFQNLQIPSSLPSYPHWADAKYYNGKYYFGIRSDSGQVWIYDSLSSSPIVASYDVGEYGTGHGCLGIADGKITTSYTRYRGSDDYSLGFVGITGDGGTVEISSHYGASSSSYQPLPTAIWKFAGKYYYVAFGSNITSSYVYLTVNQADSLSDTPTQIKYISTDSTLGKKNNPWATYMVTDNAILLPDKTYINLNNKLKSWENTSSISQSQCMSFSQTDSAIYAMCPQYEIWRSSKSAQFKLPKYSPATGLRAYIKAKD